MIAEKTEFLQSGNRPENREIFRLPQFSSYALANLWFVNALSPTGHFSDRLDFFSFR